MRIAFVPMVKHNGLTAGALLTGMALAYKQAKDVRMCFTGNNRDIPRYMGRDEDEKDVTRSITQVSKLLQARAISPDELSNYCVKLGPNLELMDTYAESLTPGEMQEIMTFVYERSSTAVTICDCAEGVEDPGTLAVLEKSDVVVWVCDQSYRSLHDVVLFRESPAFKRLNPEARQMLLVVEFDPVIKPLKQTAAEAGMTLRDTCKIRYNPYIAKGCERRDLHSVAVSIFEKDWRVIELYRDLLEITQFLLSATGEKIRWED